MKRALVLLSLLGLALAQYGRQRPYGRRRPKPTIKVSVTPQRVPERRNYNWNRQRPVSVSCRDERDCSYEYNRVREPKIVSYFLEHARALNGVREMPQVQAPGFPYPQHPRLPGSDWRGPIWRDYLAPGCHCVSVTRSQRKCQITVYRDPVVTRDSKLTYDCIQDYDHPPKPLSDELRDKLYPWTRYRNPRVGN